MNEFSKRTIKFALVVIFTLLVLAKYSLNSIAMLDNSYFSGWALFACIIFLSLFSLRKAVTFLPIGSAALWRRLHNWVGICSIIFFICHLNFETPLGTFENALAFVFLIIVSVGVLGLVFSRLIPRRLAVHGKEVLFERIPVERKTVQSEFEKLIRTAVKEGKTELFSDQFLAKLHHFFSAPRGLLLHLFDSQRPQYGIQRDITALKTQVGVKEKEYLEELSELVKEKNHLDYCLSHQFILKYWPTLHAPLTGALLLLVFFHIMLIHSFTEI